MNDVIYQTKNRWRLILGGYSENELGGMGEGGGFSEIDGLLDFLYGREYGEERGVRADVGEGTDVRVDTREGGRGPSQIVVPEWIRKIRKVFPKEVVERLENDALDRYQLTEILTDKKVLESMQPNMNLLKNILSLKDRMSGEVVETAKRIVRQVVEQLAKKLEDDIRRSFSGKVNRNESTDFKISKNFDFKKTIRKNLKYYDKELGTVIPHRIYFNPRVKKFNPFNIIICIDQSGSMLESVIYSAIMASIFAKLPVFNIKLVIFDTQIVDLSGYVEDPVDVLMSVQLGGGTNIGKAMEYCETLIETPLKTIMVMVTDLCDGYGYKPMYSSANRIVESGAKLFVMTGMDAQSQAMCNRAAAEIMAGIGAKVAAVTPESLADWIFESMRQG